jgi:acyl carrier protein
MYNRDMSEDDLISEIINYIKNFLDVMNYKLDKDLDSGTLILEHVVGFDSLELAGLVAHLETLTDKDPFEEGFLEFFTIGELARLFSSK